MKAVQVSGTKDSPKITLTDSLPKPTPQGCDLLIKIHGAGITADELSWLELYDSTNQVPGHDLSGVVEALGPEYDGKLSIGDSVYAMLRATASQGCQAEYALVPPDEVAVKPASISHAEAAALPIPILTAWEAIFERAKLEKGSRILVTGASGAVGAVLVQVANRLLDAEVTGLASTANHAYLKDLGASHVIDYNSPDWEHSLKPFDAIFDTVGSSTLEKTWGIVRRQGTIVTVADPPPSWASEKGDVEKPKGRSDVKAIYFIVTARGDVLEKAATLLDQGTLKPLPVKVFQGERAEEAWGYAGQRSRQGKAVIEFASEA